MLEFIAIGAIAWLDSWLGSGRNIEPLELLPWEKSAIFQLPPKSTNLQDFATDSIVDIYLQNLTREQFDLQRQGIWVQTGWTALSDRGGKIPLPAASLTKIATTLAALNQWGTKHQFPTDVYITGEIVNGVVTGDLIVAGNGDPLFVWEEAIALGNAIQQSGIEEVRGDLLVTDRFYMNYERSPLTAGELFKQALNREQWQPEITRQYLQMPVGTKQPEIAITKGVRTTPKIPADARLLVRHRSLPLSEILRQMNIYSNNQMAQMLADLVGGADAVARISAEVAGFPKAEIQLINGSGLGEANRISPRAVCQMLMAIDRLLLKDSLTAADLFPTAGKDLVGTLQGRGLPRGTTVKTGTLDRVSALAGMIPAGNDNRVYFSIINYGDRLDYFRQQQDRLLNEIVQTWQLLPNEINFARQDDWYLGDPQSFMSGIGVIIILLQIGPFFGHQASANVVESVGNFPEFVANANPFAVILGILTLAIVFLTPAKITRIVPSPLIALIVGTIVAVAIGNNYPDNGLRLIGDIPSGLPSIHLPAFDIRQLRSILGYSLMLAVLGSIDSLLTSLVADNITHSQHNSDRELIGQGIGNTISGLCGGLPGAGATMRTVINVKSGGKTPISGMIHALVLLIIVLKAGELTSNIPHAVLAGILIKVGIDIIDWSFIKRAHRISVKATGLMYIVLFLTVFVDLITAVAVGVFFANLLTVKSLSDIQSKKVKVITNPDDDTDLNFAEKHILKRAEGRILLFNLTGPMSFGAAKTISQRMGIVNQYEVLILDLSDVPLLGVTASLAIENIVKDASRSGRLVFLVGAEGKVKKRLQDIKLLDLLHPDRCFTERLFALQKAIAYIESPSISLRERAKAERDSNFGSNF